MAAPIAAFPSDGPARFVIRDGSAAAFFSSRGIALSLVAGKTGRGWGIHWGLVGARAVEPAPEGPLNTRVNYFTGPNQGDWREGQPAYSAMRYKEVVPGIDLVADSRVHGVHYTLEAAAGADVSSIRMRYEGAEQVTVADEGRRLEIATGVGKLTETGLHCFQLVGGQMRDVNARYASSGRDEVRLALGPHDSTLPIVIDPVIGWSSFLGGTGLPRSPAYDDARAVAVDAAGNAYVTGSTSSTDFPVVGGFDILRLGQNTFVTKVDASGSSLVCSTYVCPGWGQAIALDSVGNVYVAGSMYARTLPFTPSFGSPGRFVDSFVCKLDASGSRLLWGGYLAGSQDDYAYGIAVDDEGGAVVTGWTASPDFPVVKALQPNPTGQNAFITRIHPSGTHLDWSTYLGGGSEFGYGVALDAARNVYVTGYTYSSSFPIVGGFQSTIRSDDAYVAKIAADGSRILWSSFLGGSYIDIGRSIAVDAAANVYVAGETYSSDFPIVGAASTPPAGGVDAFLVRINASGASIDWSTCLGGTADDLGRAVAVDSAGNVHLVGDTLSADFPVLSPYQPTFQGIRDAFVARFGADGTRHRVSFQGGAWDDWGFGIAVGPSGEATIVGSTSSADFPTAGGFDSTRGGGRDGFVSRVRADGSGLVWSSYLGGSITQPGDDLAREIAVDDAGNVYVTGETSAADFPGIAGAFDATVADFDAFVTKLDASGSRVLWSSYLGGSRRDVGWGIAVDRAGCVYVGGATLSADFPLQNPLRSANAGGEAFVAKIDSSGTRLVWCTFLGGAYNEEVRNVAVDSQGDVYVTGYTLSPDFPVVGGFSGALHGGGDAFVTKLRTDGTAIVWSTYLGGTGGEVGHGIAVDDQLNVYVAGETSSTDFPTVAGFAPTAPGGTRDAFVAKIDSSGSRLLWSSYLGGSGEDKAYDLAIDTAHNVYVTGFTRSTDFPTTRTFGTPAGLYNANAFVVKVNASGASLAWSVQLGGSNDDYGSGVDVDAAGNVYISGTTGSGDFPSVGAVAPRGGSYGYDAFAAKINPSATQLLWSTPLGGTGSDEGYGIAVDAQGRAYVTDFTSSFDFPTQNAFDTKLGYFYDAFVTRIDRTQPPILEITSPTTQSAYTAFADPIVLGGYASDDDGIASVVWRNETTGALGAAQGTSFWTASVPVVLGANTITVTATDLTGLTSSDTITVTLAPPLLHTYIAKKSIWKYNDQGVDLGTAWQDKYYGDAAWAQGPGILGYGEKYIDTQLSSGSNPSDKPMTAYFRKAFFVGDPHKVASLTLNVMYDDGFAVYGNGIALLSANMPPFPVRFTTPALTAVDASNTYQSFVLDPQFLQQGFNVLAIEVHQYKSNSTDLVFDAELTGTVNMLPDTTPPTAAITSPRPLEFFGGTFDVIVTATDNLDLDRVELYVDGALVAQDRSLQLSGYYRFPWNSATVSNGAHVFIARAVDGSGNVGSSAAVTAFVSNGALRLDTLISARSIWKYNDTGQDLSSVWINPAYDDSSWPSGPGPLGYGEPYIATTVSYGTSNAEQKNITTYFRRTFEVPSGAWLRSLTARVMYDDGFALYLNGLEIARANLPSGATFSTPAVAEREANNAYQSFDLSSWLWFLHPGTNSLAVEVHQVSRSSDDLVFDLELVADEVVTDVTPPTAAITAPSDGSAASGVIDVAIAASDDFGLWKVELYADAFLVGTAYTSPLVVSWDTRRFTNGVHALTAKAYDLAGNVTTSAPVHVTVSNP